VSEDYEVTLVVKIKMSEPPDQQAVDRVAHFAAVHLNRGFGIDRLSIWHEGRRFIFDPAHESDQYGPNAPSKWVERPVTPVIDHGANSSEVH